MRIPFRGSAGVAALALLPSLLAQTAGSLEGVISNAVTGIPIKKALVTLRSETVYTGYQVLTDAAGRFRFDDVQPGRYALCAEAQGFAAGVPDAERSAPASSAVNVAAGQKIKDLALLLSPLAILSGRILDENGEPVRGAKVQAMRYAYSREGRRLYGGATVPATSNDRGEYRIIDIPPGRWYIQASKDLDVPQATGRVHGAPPERAYAFAFYPGVAEERQAAPIELEAGADLMNIDVRLAAARTFRIRGKVIDTRTGGPAAAARIHVDNQWYVSARKDGSFEVGGMLPGDHLLAADVAQDKIYSAARPVTIADRDVNDLIFHLAPGIAVRGTILLDGVPAAGLRGRVSLEPVSGALPGASERIGADGTFELGGVAPQEYRISVQPGGKGLYLKSLRFAGRDVSDDALIDVTPGCGPLTVIAAKDSAQVTGVVRPAGGTAPVRIMLAPEDRLNGRFDLFHAVDPDDDTGAFAIEAIAPGEYRLFAWELVDTELAEYPGFRALLESKATAITLRSGEHKTISPVTVSAAEIAAARKKLP